MIRYGEQLNAMITHEKITSIRVKNFGKKVCDIIASTPEELINELKKIAPSISSYGKLNFFAGDDESHKNNFAHAREWLVAFPAEGIIEGKENNYSTSNGYNKQVLDLTIQLETMKLKNTFEERLRLLEDNKGDNFMQYLPFVAPMLGMKDDDMLKRLQMSMMIKSPSMLTGMLSGANTPATASNSAEADKMIGTHLDSISKKVSPDKMLKLVAMLDKNPMLADTLVGMIPQQQTGLAGAEEKKEEQFKPKKNNPRPGLYLACGDNDMY